MTIETYNQPPKNVRRIYRVADLPQDRRPATYTIANAGSDPINLTLDKRQRQVLDALMIGPVYSASPVRISDMVLLLREAGVDIETLRFDGDPGTGAGRFGIYVLRSAVARSDEMEMAA